MRILLSLLLLSFSLSAREIPSLSGPVIDEAKIFTTDQKWQLSSVLKNVNEKYGIQVQVFIARDMGGDAIENFSIRAVDQWKLGSAKGDKGLLLVMAMAEKKIRIEVGQGLEGVITDAQAGILIQSLTPYFRRGDFSTGILVGVNGLLGLAGVQTQAASVGMNKQTKKKPIGIFTLSFLVIFFIFEMLTRRRRGSALFYGAMLGGGLSSSSRSGGFSSGGGWSGGGGGFSGGGASGGW
tara:strand:+ start:16977 stop:17690 length:714 start_codon:yes stop_codon:yes gene_type:complete